ncbi:MAG: cobyrinate a,c-diamide synthase [Burkholderiales bacterium]|nr:cobyrinate a,c-diamide synthase [Burkholderiales bacterium]
MTRLLVSAAHKSSGKTLVSIGLCAALTARGLCVQPFKKGPDYIDPMWLAQASGRPCFNLDPYLMSPEQIHSLFAQHDVSADISVIEGNKGLYDGLALDGSNSNATLAHLLDLPVVLVIDARGMTRGIAPLVLGYQAFDRNIRIAGVILNQLGGSRHEAKLRNVIEHYTDVPVLGAIAHDPLLSVTERHLGLMPSHEAADATQRIQAIGQRIAEQVDLQKMMDIAATARPLPLLTIEPRAARVRPGVPRVRIGLARDKAFGFYYPDDLAALEAAGAELVPFDTLNDPALPEVDGLFIGGGFPEMFMTELQANATLREAIASAIEAGLPVYAECGGLMYLARSLSWRGQTCRMVGAIPGDVTMHDKPVGRGYVSLATTPDALWPGQQAQGPHELHGHEFHYSSLDHLAPDVRFAYHVIRGHGVDGRHDGIVHRNVLASYTHLRNIGADGWAGHFVDFVRSRCVAPPSQVSELAQLAEPAGAVA